MIKVALTHDVDRVKKSYQYITHAVKALRNGSINEFTNQVKSLIKKNPYWNFDTITNIEKQYGVKSTFFFLNESIRFNLLSISNWQLSLGRYDISDPMIIEIIKGLDNDGWEIGLHGSYNSYNDESLLKKEKLLLEKILGHKVKGIRQHYLNWDKSTWKIQKKLGFDYDSTWGFTNNIGFKEDIITPFKPFADNFSVYPLAIMDSCYMSFTAQERWEKFLYIVETIDKNNGILVLNWHQRVFNKNEFPNYIDEYKRIIEFLLKNEGEFCTLGGFYEKNVF